MKLKHLDARALPLIATLSVFLLTYLLAAVYFPEFFNPKVLLNLFSDNAFLGVIAIGITFVIISGGIDLSVGSTLAFVGVLTAHLLEVKGMDPVFVVFLMLFLGTMLGSLMGSLIHFFKLQPFLVTLVGMFFIRGLTFMISFESTPVKNDSFVAFSECCTIGSTHFPISVIIFFCLLLFGIYLSRYTRFGMNTYAIGSNEQSAILMGLPVGRNKILIYAFNGFTSALGGILYVAYTLSGYSRAGIALELDAIAVVVIGGTLLTGGVGLIEGTFFGVLIYGMIQNIIIFQGNLSSWWTKIIIGSLILIFTLLQGILLKLLNKAK